MNPLEEAKPEHNRYDNIYEIRTKYRVSNVLDEVLKEPFDFYVILKPLKPIKFHFNPVSFIWNILKLPSFDLPVWKILCPSLRDKATGTIYYVVESDKTIEVFRGTYGYNGTGCHESALVEEFLERRGVRLEVRDGDYLLTLLKMRG